MRIIAHWTLPMDADSFGTLLYLMLLALALSGYVILQNRRKLGELMRHAALWGLIIIGTVAAVGLWEDIRSTVVPRQAVFSGDGGERIELPRARDGHFYLSAMVNGALVDFVVDTGAGEMVLTREDAQRVGLPPEALNFLSEARTANGRVHTAAVRLDEVQVGEIIDRNVRAWVNGGEMDRSLLGMGYLRRFERLEMTRDTLTLIR